MYKRIPLFSSELFENASNDPELRKNIEFQMRKVYDDELEIGDGVESDTLNEYSPQTNFYSPGQFENNHNVEFVGKFKCILCPNRTILNDLDLEKHLKSKNHIKMIGRWNKEQKKAEDLRRKFNQYHNICDHYESENEEHPNEDISLHTLDINTTLKFKKKRKKNNNLTDEQIRNRKMKFIRKKERRAMRKLQIE